MARRIPPLPLPQQNAQTRRQNFMEVDLGFTEEDYRWLPTGESAERIGITPNLGASYTPHCAAIHPARLVHGLAATVRARGVAIFEGTPVLSFSAQRLELAARTIKADRIIRATEGYTDSLRGERLPPPRVFMRAGIRGTCR